MAVYKNYAGEISEELDSYRKKGQKEASANRPATDSTKMDENESTLLSKAGKWYSDEQRIFDSVLTETSRAVAEISQKTTEWQGRVDQLLSDNSLTGKINADLAEEKSKLVAATQVRLNAQVDWNYLRASNNIHEQAVYPESLIWHFAIIGAFAFVELLINAFFYENEQGLLGGFTVALGVAVVNIAGSAIAGYFFRFKNSAAIDKKLIGWICGALFVFFTIYCNALFAAFRSEYQILVDPTDALQVREGFALAAAEARKVFWFDMHFADLVSLVLFGVGIILSGFAFYKGYTLDDQHPKYGRLDRALQKARNYEIQLQELVRQRLKDFLHHQRADIQSLLNEPMQLSSLAARRIADLSSARALAVNQSAAIQRDFAMVLNAYRHANAAVRTIPTPAYYTEIPDLTSHIDVSGTEGALVSLKQIQEKIKIQRDTYQEALNIKQQNLQIDAVIVLKDTFNTFVKEIEEDAEDNIIRSKQTIHRDIGGSIGV